MTRCSDASEARGEPLTATASAVRCFLLLEDPGPWGPEVLDCERVPDALRGRLRGWTKSHGLRPLLIRRPGRDAGGPRRVFVVNSTHRWMQTALVDDLAEVADWDLSGLRTPDGVGLTPHAEPIVLVCTHGRHDPCCAVRGRPLAAGLAEAHPDLVWESSHLGGDRFAGNMVVLPRGDYFGRLDGDSGRRVLAKYLADELELEHHRGRSGYRPAVQVAAVAARRAVGATHPDDVTDIRLHRGAEWQRVELVVAGQPIAVDVRVFHREPELLTCRAQRAQPALDFEVRLVGDPGGAG